MKKRLILVVKRKESYSNDKKSFHFLKIQLGLSMYSTLYCTLILPVFETIYNIHYIFYFTYPWMKLFTLKIKQIKSLTWSMQRFMNNNIFAWQYSDHYILFHRSCWGLGGQLIPSNNATKHKHRQVTLSSSVSWQCLGGVSKLLNYPKETAPFWVYTL